MHPWLQNTETMQRPKAVNARDRRLQEVEKRARKAIRYSDAKSGAGCWIEWNGRHAAGWAGWQTQHHSSLLRSTTRVVENTKADVHGERRVGRALERARSTGTNTQILP